MNTNDSHPLIPQSIQSPAATLIQQAIPDGTGEIRDGNFQRFEQALLFAITGETKRERERTQPIHPNLYYPIRYRLSQISQNPKELSQFIEDTLAALRDGDFPPVLSTYCTIRSLFAVRAAQRLLGIPEENLSPWPEGLRKMLETVENPALKQILQEDMALPPPAGQPKPSKTRRRHTL